MDKFDAGSHCPKCDHDIVVSIYYPDYRKDTRRTRLPEAGVGEHIERTCQRCQYKWPQEAMASPSAPAKQLYDGPG
jgi:hypothetical protein